MVGWKGKGIGIWEELRWGDYGQNSVQNSQKKKYEKKLKLLSEQTLL